jgi:hypothetical protein
VALVSAGRSARACSTETAWINGTQHHRAELERVSGFYIGFETSISSSYHTWEVFLITVGQDTCKDSYLRRGRTAAGRQTHKHTHSSTRPRARAAQTTQTQTPPRVKAHATVRTDTGHCLHDFSQRGVTVKNVIPPTVGHKSRELPGGVCRCCVEAGASGVASAIRVPLPDPSPCRSRLGNAAEPVAAHLIDSIQNALGAVDDDGVGHALSVVRHKRACRVAAIVVCSVVSECCSLSSEAP